MFTKLFLSTIVSMLALSAFSADTQTGRYRTEGPSGGGSGGQAGRYSVKYEGVASGATQTGWSQIGQSQVAGRYSQSQSGYAMTRAYNFAPEAAHMTQRAPAVDVSNKPAPKDQK